MKQKLRRLIPLLLLVSLLFSATAHAEMRDTILFNDDTSSIVSFQDTLYILRNGGLYMLDGDTMLETLATDAINGQWSSEDCVDTLLTGTDGLYAYRYGAGTLLQVLDANNQLTNKTILQVEDGDNFDKAFLQDDALYLINTYGNEQTLRKTLLADGAASELTLKNIDSIAAYKDGQAIVTTSKRVNNVLTREACLLDLESGQLTQLLPIDFIPRATTYDAKNNCLYLVDTSQIYRLKLDGIALEPACYVMGGDKSDVASFGGNMVAVTVDGCIDIRNLDNAPSQASLVVRHPYGRSVDYKSFITTHPEISLRFSGDTALTAEEQFIQDMTTRNPDTDIYLLTNKNLISTIYAKGYGVDLAADDKLNAVVDNMYTPYNQFFKQDGKIYALPQRLFVTMLGYNMEFFETYQQPLPTTYNELFDLAMLWLDDYAFDEPDAYFNLFEQDVDLTTILERYADECAGNNQAVTYNTPEMAAITQKYLDVYAAYDASGYQRSGNVRTPFNMIDVPQTNSIYGSLPMAINPDNQAVISGRDLDLAYFVINPYSLHQQQAIEFLGCVADDWSNSMKLLLLQSEAHPMESIYYAEEKVALELRVNQIKEELSTADPSDVATLKDQLKQAEADLAYCENFKWDVTQQDIDWYQGIVDSIYISDLNPFTILQESGVDFFAQLEAGTMNPERFLKTLDERVQSIYMEGE